MFECPNCGQNLKFDIASQQMACAYCDSQFNPYSIEQDVDAKNTEYFETTVFSCPQCGVQGERYVSQGHSGTHADSINFHVASASGPTQSA